MYRYLFRIKMRNILVKKAVVNIQRERAAACVAEGAKVTDGKLQA